MLHTQELMQPIFPSHFVNHISLQQNQNNLEFLGSFSCADLKSSSQNGKLWCTMTLLSPSNKNLNPTISLTNSKCTTHCGYVFIYLGVFYKFFSSAFDCTKCFGKYLSSWHIFEKSWKRAIFHNLCLLNKGIFKFSFIEHVFREIKC